MGWQFWIDRGGTFTDIVALSPQGRISTAKLLSVDPSHYDDAAVHGMRAILKLEPSDNFPSHQVDVIKVGTTVATNALLERTGEPTAIAITEGLGDVLRIGTQHRPRLFDLNIILPDMLYTHVIEIRERVSANGALIRPLDIAHARAAFSAAFDSGLRALAIVLMHADRFPAHEQQLEIIARDVGFTQISVSHRVSPVMKIIGRGDTTVADAYLSPKLRHYIDSLSAKTNGTRLYVMQSNGGLASPQRLQGKDAVLSGPAGGVVGVGETARAAGYTRVIGFDMGGTSTDVSHIAGKTEWAYETTVAGVRLRTPMMKIHTVAAGGGSICSFDGLRLRVGPESAGSHPGPACYGKGGPLTVTDCNVHLGKIHADHFPHVFGADGKQAIDPTIVKLKLTALAKSISAVTGKSIMPAKLAADFIAIAVDNMARAIKRISVEQGHDVSAYALGCFGGAGGQHACLVAEALDMSTVIIHPLAGVLSAYGIGLARQSVTRQQSVEQPLNSRTIIDIAAKLDQLVKPTEQELRQDVGQTEIVCHQRLHLRSIGSDTALVISFAKIDQMRIQFAERYRAQFGFEPETREIICESIEVEIVQAASIQPTSVMLSSHRQQEPQPLETTSLVSKHNSYEAQVYQREELPTGSIVHGPALIIDANSTTVVEVGWQATVAGDGHLILTRHQTGIKPRSLGPERDPARIEIFSNFFMSIAERMGGVLQSTARSVNIKERLDFSCAVFDTDGNLIANAPHMPVHLGSMGESVRVVRLKHAAAMKPGDSYVLNAPHSGGTHLPDITVVTPIFRGHSDKPLFYTACRGHHADIGGLTPGSMPPQSKTIRDEGVLLDNLLLVRDGDFREGLIRELLEGGPYPARSVSQNIADLKAQVAATTIGGTELLQACESFGVDVVCAYMSHIQDYAEEAMRRALGKLNSGTQECPMDDGSIIKVAVTIDHDTRSAVVDFTGTSPQRPTNFNAPRSVCRAAVLYVFRTLIDEDIPLNDGCMRPITLHIPPGSMLDPDASAAVVAGNVETSQIICDALYGALGVLAASQGTMNNFTFGDATRQYYETICGGAGAGPTFHGASAIQTHMTNSRLTDPEILEWRFPVVLEKFAIRTHSGGYGKYCGGDGVERRLKFVEPVTASILSGRRKTRPFGLHGGDDGAAGQTFVQRAGGQIEPLGATASVDIQPGDQITIRTPGGGGYGRQ